MTKRKPADTPEEPVRLARGPVTLARVADRLTRPLLGKRGFTGAEVISRWNEIVGEELAVFACPLQVKYPRGRNAGATLQLRVATSAAAALLQLKTPTIVSRVNRYFGYEAVTHLQASHGPLPQRAQALSPAPEPPPCPETVAALTASISSDALRAALRKLGARLQHQSGVGVVRQCNCTRRVSSGGESDKDDDG